MWKWNNNLVGKKKHRFKGLLKKDKRIKTWYIWQYWHSHQRKNFICMYATMYICACHREEVS